MALIVRAILVGQCAGPMPDSILAAIVMIFYIITYEK